MIVWVIAGLLGLATGLRIGWALVNKQSLVSAAMILALGSLCMVAALNWQPLTLLIDTLLRWPDVSMGLSQVALIGCAAGSCVMITTVISSRKPATTRRVAMAQYGLAAIVAVASLATFFVGGRQPEMAPEEYLKRNLGGTGTWLVPLVYVVLAMTLATWDGLRHSNRTRRGRALFLFTVGIGLIVLAGAFVLLKAWGSTEVVGVGAAGILLGCAMAVVAVGSLLPSVEDWFGARRELHVIRPLLDELDRRHPDIGIGVRPRGPLVFRVAERMSLISDGLFLEASAAQADKPDPADPPSIVTPQKQARAIAAWIYSGRDRSGRDGQRARATRDGTPFPGSGWLSQPASYSDREWILEIAQQYWAIDRTGATGGSQKKVSLR